MGDMRMNKYDIDPRTGTLDEQVYGVMTLTDNGWKMEVHKFVVRDRAELDRVIELFTKLREFMKAD